MRIRFAIDWNRLLRLPGYLATLVLLFPLVVAYHSLALIVGRAGADRRLGPLVTGMAAGSLRWWVPPIRDASGFGDLSRGMRRRLRWWRLFYHVEITEDSPGALRLRISNCPPCEMLRWTGLSGLCPHLCQGDWVVARANADKWDFAREHQIGTGDGYCDHSYLAKGGTGTEGGPGR